MIIGAAIFFAGLLIGWFAKPEISPVKPKRSLKDTLNRTFTDNDIEFIDIEEKNPLEDPIKLP